MTKFSNNLAYFFKKGKLFTKVVLIVILIIVAFAGLQWSFIMLNVADTLFNILGFSLLIGLLVLYGSLIIDFIRVYINPQD